MATTEGSSVRLRTIYVGDAEQGVGVEGAGDVKKGSEGDWDWLNTYSNRNIAQASTPTSTNSNGGGGGGGGADRFNDNNGADEKEVLDGLELPESTHSLLFTEKTCSVPHFFSVAIVIISVSSLALAFLNNVTGGSSGNLFKIPVNVSTSVRAAQYLSIFIALLMEEEIPTGLYLLRQIRKKDFNKKLKDKNYKKFVFAAVLRILLGYFFLINVFVVLIQATGVIDIFYDVLALQFVQQLDDIGFNLSKIEVLGQRMRQAVTAPAFRIEFEKQKHHCRKQDAILKSLYFLNFGCFLAGLIVVSIRQCKGYYQCDSITAKFGNEVTTISALSAASGEYEDFTLVFSYFDGVYEKEGYHAGRPIYKERRKFDRQPYKGNGSQRIQPAEIRYCEDINAWIFTHEHIKKGNDDSGCNWLLRSPETDSYDLLEVNPSWSIWVGVIGSTSVSITCNECNDNTDCNLNGQCVDGSCQCYRGDGAQFLGMHCETKLTDECQTIIGEGNNETFSISYYSPTPNGTADVLFQEYSRPVYTYISGMYDVHEDDIIWMMYTGSRWFGMWFNLEQINATEEELVVGTQEFHAFWNQAYSTVTMFVSDPTEGSTPVGTDWYSIGERGSQYGHFGALYPVQLYNQTGRGFFRCAGEYTPPNNVSATDRRKLQYRELPGKERFL